MKPTADTHPSETSAVFHTVREGETLWEIAAAHRVSIGDIKAANGIAPGEVLKVGQVLRILSSTGESPRNTAASNSVDSFVAAALPPETMGLDASPEERALEAEASELSGAKPPASLSPEPRWSSPLKSNTLSGFEDQPVESTQDIPGLIGPSERGWTNYAVSPENGLSPVEGVAPTESPPSESVINADSQEKPLRVAALVEPSQSPNPAELPSGSSSVYEVQNGDTVWTIATSYGVSPDKLLEQNPDLLDPNMIQAGQILQVPARHVSAVSQPTAVASEPRNMAAANLATIQSSRETLETRENASSSSSLSQSSQPEDLSAIQTSSTTAESSAQSDDGISLQFSHSSGETDPHVASLIAEIHEIQQQNADVAVLSPSVEATQIQSQPADYPVNPEFSEEGREPTAVAEQQDQLMAAAPLSSEAYMPRPVSPVGETVSPDLPILPQPDEFLPEAPNRFEGYIWPAQGVLTSGYGWRWGRMHRGVDVAGPVGTPIFAAAPGVVVRSGWNSGGYGNLVDIRHPDGSLTRYAHNSRLNVQAGQEVRQGQKIAEMGSTGYSTGPHLHFEIHLPDSGTVNPIAYLPNR